MVYNLHPIFVHFPIALLTVYSIVKVLPFRKWFPKVAWRDVERALLAFGVLGAWVSLSTGEVAEELNRELSHKIVETHASFATASAWIYGALLVGEITSWFYGRFGVKFEEVPYMNKVLLFLEKLLCNPGFSKLLAIAGFMAIFVTGLLRGVMVHGVGADPLAPTVLQVLGL